MSIKNWIPDCLIVHEDFRRLPESEQAAIAMRLAALKELGEEISNGTRKLESGSIFDFLDNIELDLSVRAFLPAGQCKLVSIWEMHYTWTSELNQGELTRFLPEESINDLNILPLASDSKIEEIYDWFSTAGRALVRTVGHIGSSKAVPEVLAFHVVVDAVVANMLLSAYRSRLNPKIAAEAHDQ